MWLFKLWSIIYLVALTSKYIYFSASSWRCSVSCSVCLRSCIYELSGSLLWSPVLPKSNLLKNSSGPYSSLYLPRQGSNKLGWSKLIFNTTSVLAYSENPASTYTEVCGRSLFAKTTTNLEGEGPCTHSYEALPPLHEWPQGFKPIDENGG